MPRIRGTARDGRPGAPRRPALAVSLWAAVALGTATTAPAQPPPIQTVEFHADSVERTMRYNIVLPSSYADDISVDRYYPTLYLLHGADSNPQAWRDLLPTPRVARDDELIIVMPDAGNSFYVNWARSDDAHANAWEDYIVEDVVGHVEANYRALSRREGRAIAGFSMGGYGALVIGLRHPELFVSIGSQSGTLDYGRSAAARLRIGGLAHPPQRYAPEIESRRTVNDPNIGMPGFSSLTDRTPNGQPFVTSEQADAHDPFMLVMRVPRDTLPFIQIDCGTGDPGLPTTQSFISLLLDADIPFDFTQRRGGHDSAYWMEAYRYAPGLHAEAMRGALGWPVR